MHFEELVEMGVMSDEFLDTPQYIYDESGEKIIGIDLRGAEAPVDVPAASADVPTSQISRITSRMG
jgi:hypothetical protein